VSQFIWTAERVCEVLDTEVREGDGELRFFGVSTDSRAIEGGSLFVALIGERFDAHEFLDQVHAKGALGAVVRTIPEGAPTGLRYFVVPDTLVALGDLAQHRRRALAAAVIAVAGSNGKTTTKDLLRAALGSRFRVHATQGNLNNRIGLPLTLLAAPDDAEVLVLEMGTNEPGEIWELCRIAEPETGIVTSIGEEHLEKLGDLHGVLIEETQLLDALPPHGFGYVAEEPPELPERAVSLMGADRVLVAGYGEEADLRPDEGREGVEVLPDGSTRWLWQGEQIHVPIPGRHNVRNALLALGVANRLSVPAGEAAAGIAAMPAPKLRGEWHRVGGIRVLADCYNSNPPSVVAAAELLASLPADGEKIVVVGTMRELGPRSEELHRSSAGTLASKVGRGIDRVVATGDFATAFAELTEELGPRLVICDDPVAAFESVKASLTGSETILLKGSRGVALERWLPLLRQHWEPSETA
jgi:UDP-N-acetylmuramoyl-tripeptide--D-alanyl-D-alanine ligase